MRISDWSSDVCSSDLLAGWHVLALLPVGQRGLGVAQGVLADASLLAQLLVPRLRIGDGFLQHLQARLVAVDVLADLGQRGLGLVACALQALRHLALVGDLLLDAGEVAADFVTFGLRLVQRFRSEEHTSELQSLMRNSYAVFCLK